MLYNRFHILKDVIFSEKIVPRFFGNRKIRNFILIKIDDHSERQVHGQDQGQKDIKIKVKLNNTDGIEMNQILTEFAGPG